MQTMLLLDFKRNLICFYAALRTDIDTTAAANTIIGYQIPFLLLLRVTEGEQRSLNWLFAEVEPFAAALTELEHS